MKSTLTILAASAVLTLSACSPQPEAKTESAAAMPAATPAPAPAKPVDVPAGAYTIDKAHASLTFRLTHMGFSNYTARFLKFDAQLQLDPVNLAASSVSATIDPLSLELNAPPPGFQQAITGAQWLDAAKFPAITFKSTQVEATGGNSMRITGDLTLHGVTHPIVLNAVLNGGYAGFAMDPHARVGFSAHGSFKRSDFGISIGIPAPGTTMGVGDEVSVDIESEFSGPAWTAPAGDQAPPANNQSPAKS
jgi:polyisoprenoid-binding protein YceI